MAIDKNFDVQSISLVKFKTPMYCRKSGGLLNNSNDTHWGVIINGTTMIHWADDDAVAESWVPSNNSPTPCSPYLFTGGTRQFILKKGMYSHCVSCHEVCKLIFAAVGIEIMTGAEIVSARLKVAACSGVAVAAGITATVLTAGAALVLGGVAVAGGVGAYQNLIKDGHEGVTLPA